MSEPKVLAGDVSRERSLTVGNSSDRPHLTHLGFTSLAENREAPELNFQVS